MIFYLIFVYDFIDMLDESDCEVKFVKELYLCEFFFCDCLKWELKRDIIGSLDCNEEKEIREMDRCFWDVSDEFGILD